jgi:hypothetical protein
MEARVQSIDMRGPLFIAGYSEQYSPTYLSVRTKEFFHGNLRSLRINDKQVDWLMPRNSSATGMAPESHRFTTNEMTSNNFHPYSNSPSTTVQRSYETKSIVSSTSTKPFI